MYATIRSYSGGAELTDALVENESAIRDEIRPIAGFRAYFLIRGEDGNTTTVSVFDDEAGADESVRVAADWVRTNLVHLSPAPPTVTSGEVAISF
jgi:hypothetical protein